MEKYRAVELRDSWDEDIIYQIIMLNKKHSIKDMQEAINRAKETRQEDINKYGDDWTWITQELEKEGFDWYELDYEDDYLVY